MAGEEPEVVIGCFGGGSNFGGLALPYVLDRLAGKGPRIVAVEPSACPSLTKGTFAYDYGDTAKLTPLIKMYTLGHDFVPPGIHAGGLRYHGASPLLSHLLKLGQIEAKSYPPVAGVRGGAVFRAHRGHSAGAGIVARHSRRGRRGAAGARRRAATHHPVLPERTRPFRPGVVRELSERVNCRIMSTLGRMWRGLWRRYRPDPEWEEQTESGDFWIRSVLRLAIIFALLFGGVFFAFWWAGSAVRFSAARAGDRSLPTWRVSGMCVMPSPISRFPGRRWRMTLPVHRLSFGQMPVTAAIFY